MHRIGDPEDRGSPVVQVAKQLTPRPAILRAAASRGGSSGGDDHRYLRGQDIGATGVTAPTGSGGTARSATWVPSEERFR